MNFWTFGTWGVVIMVAISILPVLLIAFIVRGLRWNPSHKEEEEEVVLQATKMHVRLEALMLLPFATYLLGGVFLLALEIVFHSSRWPMFRNEMFLIALLLIEVAITFVLSYQQTKSLRQFRLLLDLPKETLSYRAYQWIWILYLTQFVITRSILFHHFDIVAFLVTLFAPLITLIFSYVTTKRIATSRGTTLRKLKTLSPLSATFIVCLMIVLGLIFLPPVSTGPHSRGNRAVCSSHVREIGMALKLSAIDHHDQYPTGSTSTAVFATLIKEGYLENSRIFVCRASTNTVGSVTHFTAANNSYSCVAGIADGSIGLSDSVSLDTPLVFDTGLGGVTNGTPLLDANGKKWSSTSAHKRTGGNIFYIGGNVDWKTNFYLSHDVTNGFILNP